jgi:hypothetical protein
MLLQNNNPVISILNYISHLDDGILRLKPILGRIIMDTVRMHLDKNALKKCE